ncbi:hypothetical protein AVEN_59393-1 [Araneus ventricosus]|uniref:Uncharacterized protein n=1 Tax=Araneus ventricosus TaxID=182803 RepID=A0A4Y2LJT5_ARAVE|nr:hypothetical protein AVEN_59393-1 [Araneus ventricosus]
MPKKVFEISTRSSHTGFTAASHGILNVLKDSSRVSPAATEMRGACRPTALEPVRKCRLPAESLFKRLSFQRPLPHDEGVSDPAMLCDSD